MLETSRERVELLRSGVTGKKIEELYIILNNFKIVGGPMIPGKVKSMERGKLKPVSGTAIKCKVF